MCAVIKGVGKGCAALVPSQISHRRGSGSSQQQPGSRGWANGKWLKGLSHAQEDQERLWSLLFAPQALGWLLGDIFLAPCGGVRPNLDPSPKLPAGWTYPSFFPPIPLSFHCLHRVCMKMCLPVQVAWKLPLPQPLSFTVLCRCLSCKQNRSTMYSGNYCFFWHREINCLGLFL